MKKQLTATVGVSPRAPRFACMLRVHPGFRDTNLQAQLKGSREIWPPTCQRPLTKPAPPKWQWYNGGSKAAMPKGQPTDTADLNEDSAEETGYIESLVSNLLSHLNGTFFTAYMDKAFGRWPAVHRIADNF